jgi:hypothetical protein
VPVLVVGMVIALVGAATEAVRAAFAGKIAHAIHAAVWAAVGLVWWGAWFVLFNGAYRGPRRWVVDRVEDIHRVRLVLLIAVPAGLIGYDLMRTWLTQTDRARRRQVAATEVRVPPAPAPPSPPFVIDLRVVILPAATEPSPVDVTDHAS